MGSVPWVYREKMSYFRVFLLIIPIMYLEVMVYFTQNKKTRILNKERKQRSQGTEKSKPEDYVVLASLILQLIFWIYHLVRVNHIRQKKEGKPLKVCALVFSVLRITGKAGCFFCLSGAELISEKEEYIITYRQGSTEWKEHRTERPMALCGIYCCLFAVISAFYGLMISLAMMVYYIFGYVFLKIQFIDRSYRENYCDKSEFQDNQYYLRQRIMNKQVLNYIAFNLLFFVVPNVVVLILFFCEHQQEYGQWDIINLAVFGVCCIFYLGFMINQFFVNKWDKISQQQIDIYNNLKQMLIDRNNQDNVQDQQHLQINVDSQQEEQQQMEEEEKQKEIEKQKQLQQQVDELVES